MMLGVHHVAMATADLERLQSFYCDLLGMRVLTSGSWKNNAQFDEMLELPGSAARFVLLGSPNLALEIFQYSNPPPGEGEQNRPVNRPGITHLGFGVDDLDAAYARLCAAGVRFHCPLAPAAEGVPIRAVYGRDPDGNAFELLEFSGQSGFDYAPSQVRWRADER